MGEFSPEQRERERENIQRDDGGVHGDDSIRNVFGLRPRLVKSFAGIMESDTGRRGFFHRGEQGWMVDS